MSMFPARAAHISTFQPSSSLRSTVAPSSIRNLTTSLSPCSAAFMSEVTPSSSLASSTRLFSVETPVSAPPPPPPAAAPMPPFFLLASCASTRYEMTSRCPSLQAFMSAVSPVSSFADTRAPFSTRKRTTWWWPPMAACIKALTPSGSLASTFTFGSSSARPQASTAPDLAASMSGFACTLVDFPWLLFSAANRLLVILPGAVLQGGTGPRELQCR
mmetsp:Transcript_63337/g.137102  ORF Transcript_63337/g.137102 Transcript_63337/m.137102 type:complete len:216 (+) Transcript_63337:980-1627(+)